MRCEHFKVEDNAKFELLSKYLKSDKFIIS